MNTRLSYIIRAFNVMQSQVIDASCARTNYRSLHNHYCDAIMSTMGSQITSVCTIFCSGADQRKHQGSASLASVRGIQRWPANPPPPPPPPPPPHTHTHTHKGPVTRTMFPFDDVIMILPSSILVQDSLGHRQSTVQNPMWPTWKIMV